MNGICPKCNKVVSVKEGPSPLDDVEPGLIVDFGPEAFVVCEKHRYLDDNDDLVICLGSGMNPESLISKEAK